MLGFSVQGSLCEGFTSVFFHVIAVFAGGIAGVSGSSRPGIWGFFDFLCLGVEVFVWLWGSFLAASGIGE